MSAFFETYLSTGLKEDVLDAIEVISPKDTPVYNGLNKIKANGKRHEWLTISIPSASAVGANSYAEGDAFVYASGDAYTPTETRLQNYTQIFHKTWKISETVEEVAKYGRGSSWAFRKTQAMLGWKTDVEVALLDNSATSSGSAGVARTMVGLRTLDGLSATANSSSTLASPIDEGNLNVLLQLMFDQGVDPDRLVCSPFVKRQISGFAGSGAGRPIVINNGERTFADVLDIYESDFGRLTLIASRRLNIESNVLAYRNDLNSIPILRPPTSRVTPNDGDFMTGAIVGELTFQYLNPNGLGRLRRVQSA